MGRSIRRSGCLLLLFFVLGDANAGELTLQHRARKGPVIPPGLQMLANGLELQPHGACPEVEPNETTAQATVMTLPATCSGVANVGDAFAITINYSGGAKDEIEDVFSITLAAPQRLAMDLTWSNPSADLDLHVFRRNSSTGSLEGVDASLTEGSAAEGLVTDSLPSGTYYVGVSAWSGGSPYNLAVSEFATSASCTDTPQAVCLANGRFRVSATFETSTQSGDAGAVRLTGDTGYFWFFSNTNVELVVKVLNACAFNDRFWVFAGGLTDVKTTILVTDTQTGATRQYATTGGVAFAPIQDTDALATCSGTACTYGVGPTPQAFAAAGGSGTVNVTTQQGCTWTATKSGDFITLTSGTSGTGSGTVGFSVAANPTTLARSGTITAGGQVVSVTQSGATSTCEFTVAPTTVSFINSGGTSSVTVTTADTCAWTATTTTSWLTINSGASGTGNGTVSFTAAANPGTTSRSGTLAVAGKTVSVTQSGTATCTYTVSPTSQTIEHTAGSGGTITVTTQAGCAWNATTTTAWITIDGGGGTGSGSFSYSAARNEGTASRSGSISAGGRTVTISQKGDISKCTYGPPYTAKTFTWCGADASYAMQTQSGCPWTITSDVPWIDVLVINRTGPVSASYIVERNTTGAPRTGTLTAGTFTATITQAPGPTGGTYDGIWIGKTGSNRDVTLCIADGKLQTADVRVVLNAITFTCTTPLVTFQPIDIAGGAFSGPVSTYPEISNVTSTLTGTFSSPGAMTGAWTSYSGNWLIVCGSTFGIGFGGTVLSSGTYSSTKQP